MARPSSSEWNICGSPSARMITPTICTIVAIRNTQSSVSYADANQLKLIHAQQIVKTPHPNPISPARRCPSASKVRELVRRLTERHYEGQVVQQFQRRRRPVLLARVTPRHPP